MKKLIQIPRNINSKFCWQKHGPSENYKEDPIKIESKKISSIPLNNNEALNKWKLLNEKATETRAKKLELAELQDEIDAKETRKLLAENNINNDLSPSGLTEELNHNKDASFDINSEEFNYNNAMQEANALLADLELSISERGFGPMNV